MRCKICGAKLKKDGDICKNCYKEYKEKASLYADNEEVLFEIKRKYSPKFNLLKNGEIIIMLILISLSGFNSYGTILGILITVLCIVGLGLWMFYSKKRASGTKTTFYETKLKFSAKYPLVDREEIIPYSDVKDMAYFQTWSQKKCNVADIRFYTRGILSGLTIKDIPNIQENFVKMQDIIVMGKNND